MLDSLNKELRMDELIEKHEIEQDNEKFESLDPVQLEDRMTLENWTETLSLIEKRVTRFRKYRLQRRVCFFNKTRNTKIISMLAELHCHQDLNPRLNNAGHEFMTTRLQGPLFHVEENPKIHSKQKDRRTKK
ncbi:hypothetical protein TNCV_1788921 [Trichonephila clavipes]|nr:hypothetical protein TNCV_1788921 [Trichonephila clavipes]